MHNLDKQAKFIPIKQQIIEKNYEIFQEKRKSKEIKLSPKQLERKIVIKMKTENDINIGFNNINNSEDKNCSFSSQRIKLQRAQKIISAFSPDRKNKMKKTISKNKKEEFELIDNNQKNENLALEKPPKNSLYTVIGTFYMVRKFVGVMKQLGMKVSPKYLNSFHFQLINDKSFCSTTHLNSNKKKSTFIQALSTNNISISKKLMFIFDEAMFSINTRIPILDFNSSILIIWNLFTLFGLLFFFIYIPLEACFGIMTESEVYQEFKFFKTLALVILCLDIFKNLNTSFYKQGCLIVNRREIVRNYFENSFFIDLMSFTPTIFNNLDANLYDHSSKFGIILRFISFLFFLKIFYFKELFKRFEERFFLNKIFRNVIALIKLIFFILLLSHLISCFWYLIGKTSSYDTNWLSKNNLEEKDPSIQYLYSFYYVCITMSTVGYGDISPQNPTEVGFTTVITYFSSGIFAYVLNSIGNIVSDITKRSNEFSNEMNVINRYMKDKNISFELRLKIRKYLEYVFHEDNTDKLEEQKQIISKLSDNLKEELFIEANGSIIRDIKLLSLNFSEETLRKTVPILKENKYTPGEFIFANNTVNNHLFIVRSGKIELFIENRENPNEVTIIKSVEEGGVFGEKDFFDNKGKSYLAKSSDFSTIYIIKQEDFLAILKKNQKDFEKFCEIKDRINNYNDISLLYSKCPSCNMNSHRIEQCPTVHYIPFNDIIIRKHLFNKDQIRQTFKRKTYKIKALFKQKAIRKGYQDVQNELCHENSIETDEENESSIIIKKSGNNKEENNSIAEFEEEEKINEDINTFKNDMLESKNSLTSFPEENKINYKTVCFSPTSSPKAKNSKTKSDFESNNFEKRQTSFEKFPNDKSSGNSHNTQNENQEAFKQLIDKLMKKRRTGKFLNKTTRSLGTLQSDKEIQSKNINENQKHEAACQIENVSSFEQYFPEGNIENILEKFRCEQFKYIFLKSHKDKSKKDKKSNLFKELIDKKYKGQNIIPSRNSIFKNEGSHMNNMNNGLRNNFFKNTINLEKLMNDEKFNAEKIKDYYKKKYANKENIGILGKFKNFFNGFKDKIKIKKMGIRKKSIHKSKSMSTTMKN